MIPSIPDVRVQARFSGALALVLCVVAATASSAAPSSSASANDSPLSLKITASRDYADREIFLTVLLAPDQKKVAQFGFTKQPPANPSIKALSINESLAVVREFSRPESPEITDEDVDRLLAASEGACGRRGLVPSAEARFATVRNAPEFAAAKKDLVRHALLRAAAAAILAETPAVEQRWDKAWDKIQGRIRDRGIPVSEQRAFVLGELDKEPELSKAVLDFAVLRAVETGIQVTCRRPDMQWPPKTEARVPGPKRHQKNP